MIEGGGLGVFPPEEIGPHRRADRQRRGRHRRRATRPRPSRWPSSTCRTSRARWPSGSAPTSGCCARSSPRTGCASTTSAPVIETLADTGSVLELRRHFGLGMVTALVRDRGPADRHDRQQPGPPRRRHRQRRRPTRPPASCSCATPSTSRSCAVRHAGDHGRARGREDGARAPLQPAVRHRRQPHRADLHGRAAQGATGSAPSPWPAARQGAVLRGVVADRRVRRHGPRGPGQARLPQRAGRHRRPGRAAGPVRRAGRPGLRAGQGHPPGRRPSASTTSSTRWTPGAGWSTGCARSPVASVPPPPAGSTSGDDLGPVRARVCASSGCPARSRPCTAASSSPTSVPTSSRSSRRTGDPLRPTRRCSSPSTPGRPVVSSTPLVRRRTAPSSSPGPTWCSSARTVRRSAAIAPGRVRHPSLVVTVVTPFGHDRPRAAGRPRTSSSTPWRCGCTPPGDPMREPLAVGRAAGRDHPRPVRGLGHAAWRCGPAGRPAGTGRRRGPAAVRSLLCQPYFDLGLSYTGIERDRNGMPFPMTIVPAADGYLGVNVLTRRSGSCCPRSPAHVDLLDDPELADARRSRPPRPASSRPRSPSGPPTRSGSRSSSRARNGGSPSASSRTIDEIRHHGPARRRGRSSQPVARSGVGHRRWRPAVCRSSSTAERRAPVGAAPRSATRRRAASPGPAPTRRRRRRPVRGPLSGITDRRPLDVLVRAADVRACSPSTAPT